MANKSALDSVYYETLLSDELLLSIDRRTATKRKISRAFTSTPPSGNQHGSPIHSPLQVCFRDFTNSKRGTLEIPKYDKSIEVLEWIGFTSMAATKIHRKYVQRIDDSRSFLDFALRHVDMVTKLGYNRDKSIPRIMDDIGITPELQAAIYDPLVHDSLR